MFTQQNHIFIDPENCGSGIGYYLSVSEYTPKSGKTEHSVSATVVLTDCSHKIDWSFSGESVEKIDDTIKMLQEFRKKYIEAQKMIKALNK
jgi:hypothetical protein